MKSDYEKAIQKYFTACIGVRTKSWTDYVKKPNLCLYLRGLKPPKDSLIRLWLYQWI